MTPRSSNALTELLSAYEETLDRCAELPLMLRLKRRGTRLGRLTRVPRPRWLVRFFLVQHMRRMSSALRRRCYADRIAGRRPGACEDDLAALDDFERTLPSALSTRVATFVLALAVLFVAFLVAAYAMPNWTILSTAPAAAHRGDHSARLGSTGAFEGNSTLTRTLHVPRGRSTLTFWYQAHCHDVLLYDQIQMEIRGRSTKTRVLNHCSNSSTWERKRFDLRRYGGRVVTLWFNDHDDGSGGDATYFLLDDVTITSRHGQTLENGGFEKGNLSSWKTSGAYTPVVSTKCTASDAKFACTREDGLGRISSKPLGLLTSAALTLDRRQAIDGLKSFACVEDAKTRKWKDCRLSRVAASGSTALFLLPLSVWLLLLLVVVPPLRLKRLLLLVRPATVEELKRAYSAEPTTERSVYQLEAQAFRALAVRRPRELSLDLFGGTMLMVPALLVGLSLLVFVTIYVVEDWMQGYQEGDGVEIVLVTLVASPILLLAVGRMVELRRTARRRAECREGGCDMARGSAWPWRAAAQLVDAVCICALAAPFGLLVWRGIHQLELKVLLLWLGPLPAAALVYHAAFWLALRRWEGQTLGKHVFGLHVVQDGGVSPSLLRILAREVLLKWLLFAALVLPGLVNLLWPLWDYRRRAWHDIVTGTIVTRAEPKPRAEQVPKSSPATA